MTSVVVLAVDAWLMPAARASAAIRGGAVSRAYSALSVEIACWRCAIVLSRLVTETFARRTATLRATTPTRSSAKTDIQTSGSRTRRLGCRLRCAFGFVFAAAAVARLRGFGSGSAMAAGANQDSIADI